jgi:hypothetical protein
VAFNAICLRLGIGAGALASRSLASPDVGVKLNLANAGCLWGYLDALVFTGKFEALLEA